MAQTDCDNLRRYDGPLCLRFTSSKSVVKPYETALGVSWVIHLPATVGPAVTGPLLKAASATLYLGLYVQTLLMTLFIWTW
jgi:hypothetical protein